MTVVAFPLTFLVVEFDADDLRIQTQKAVPENESEKHVPRAHGSSHGRYKPVRLVEGQETVIRVRSDERAKPRVAPQPHERAQQQEPRVVVVMAMVVTR